MSKAAGVKLHPSTRQLKELGLYLKGNGKPQKSFCQCVCLFGGRVPWSGLRGEISLGIHGGERPRGNKTGSKNIRTEIDSDVDEK